LKQQQICSVQQMTIFLKSPVLVDLTIFHISIGALRKNTKPHPESTEKVNKVSWFFEIFVKKSAVRCKVEYAFKVIKDTFGFRKVRYRGIAKNFNKLNVLFACANLLMVKRVQKEFCTSKG